ncbi:MAG: hypothetical protein KA004_10975 [Verrucomicrobiales bacterium]|nr:hypothetical protein [Verrucomicrobiales bacterium]
MNPRLFSTCFAGLWPQPVFKSARLRIVVPRCGVAGSSPALRGGGSLENLDACASTYLGWMRERSLIPFTP